MLEDIELPLVHVLRAMEVAGVRLNVQRLAAINERVREEVARLEREIWDLAGDEFVIGSPQQLGAVLFEQPRPVAQAPRQDRLLDRRPRAAGDPRRASDHPDDRALARAQPARQDLPRRAAPARRRREPHPHHVRPGGGHHRADLLDQPEHAERARAHRAGPRDPRLLRGGAGPRADLAPTTRRSSCGCWPTSPTSRCSRRSSCAARTCTRRRPRRSSRRTRRS